MNTNTKITDLELDRQIQAAKEFAKTNPRIEPRANSVEYQDGEILVELSSGWSFRFDPKRIPELSSASGAELADVKLRGAGYTVEWTTLDQHFGIGRIIVDLVGEKFLRSEIARRKGSVKSKIKSATSRANGQLGGRPSKSKITK